MDFEDDEYAQELARTWPRDAPAKEPMRARDTKARVNPSREDLRLRRRVRRATAGGDMATRDEYLRAAQKASSLTEQARLLDEARKIDDGIRMKAAQARELDFANDIVTHTLAPGCVHEFHTAATDWMGFEPDTDPQWQHKASAEAAAWFGRTSALVRADADEFAIQAAGKARQIAGQFGHNASAAATTFVQFAEFLRRSEGASGLDQIQQTVDPNNSPKTTPLNPEVFDNFAPEVDPINAGVSGTEDSNRAPLLQEIMSGGSGTDAGQPEKPGGHSTTDELSWAPPSGMQADTAPGWSDGDPGSPEKGGDRPKYSSLSPAVPYVTNMDQFRALAAQSGGLGNCPGCGSTLTTGSEGGCPNCNGTAGQKEAASGLPQIDQTVDANNQPSSTPYPDEVAFPLNDDFAEQPTTNGTGNVTKVRPMAKAVQADMYGASDAPHAVPGPPVPNTPATTAPNASQAGGAAQGRADAEAGNDAPTFSDASSAVPAAVNAVGEGYQQQMQQIMEGQPKSTPGSMGGATHAGSVSALLVTAAERQDPEFRKGYGYAAAWKPGTRLVTQGSASFEAGIYAGMSDNAANQRAFATASREGGLGDRVDRHTALTHHIAAKNEAPTNGLYITAATSIELNTTAPNTTPAADGSTPINGRGNPGPLDGLQDAAAPAGAAPYNGAPPYGSPVVPTQAQSTPSPADSLIGGGGMSTPNQVAANFRKRVQAGLLADRQGK